MSLISKMKGATKMKLQRFGNMILVLLLALAALPASPARAVDYTVTNTNNSGAGSLRQAMLDANAAGGGNILFNIPDTDPGYDGGTGVWTIQPTIALPLLSGGDTTIDGYSQAGAAEGTSMSPPTIVIEIDGSSVAGQNGFNVVSAGNTIKGLAINRFGWSGIAIGGTSTMSNTITGNYIGTDASGVTDLGNILDGVSILLGAHDNTIGGDSLAEQNVIGGNGGDGIGIVGDNTTGNIVSANLIGTSRSMVDLGNASYGVNIYGGAHGNTIGVNALYQRNDIFANDLGGVRIAGANTRDNVISANDIGLGTLGNNGFGVIIADSAHDNTIGPSNDISYNGNHGVYILGTSTMSNTVSGNEIDNNTYGVVISGAQNNIIGGDTESERNVIIGNYISGIFIGGSGIPAQNNTVSGNYIGINNSGSVQANGFYGIDLNVAQQNTIGPDNVISGNTSHGVYILDGQDNTIFGNYIGTDVDGTLTPGFGNGRDGIRLGNTSIGNTIGGNTAGAGNVIDGNGENGIGIYGSNTTGNVVLGNEIGRDTLGNSGNGVVITDGAHENTVGTDNTISGNGLSGVSIVGASTMSNTVTGNSVYSNTENGVVIGNAQHNTIGGDAESERNVIYGNGFCGVSISGGYAQNNTVSGNFIGIDELGNARGNGSSGVYLYFVQNNTIGGNAYEEHNVIAANGRHGIEIIDAQNNTIANNYIGTDIYGIASGGFGNVQDGIRLDLASTGNIIGGATTDERNLIYNNGGHGVHVAHSSATSNTITHNSIEYNIGEGIKLPDSWISFAPVIAATTLGSVHITGTACAGCSVEVFQSHLASGEGLTFVGDTIADSSGTFTVTVDSLSPSEPYLTATATNATDTTSEFSDVFESTIKKVYLPLVVRNY
jgi:titin